MANILRVFHILQTYQRVKSVRIRSYSGPYFRIRIEYGEILRISPYSVQMHENTELKNFKYRHFSRSVYIQNI